MEQILTKIGTLLMYFWGFFFITNIILNLMKKDWKLSMEEESFLGGIMVLTFVVGVLLLIL
jgi:hypothetical protein